VVVGATVAPAPLSSSGGSAVPWRSLQIFASSYDLPACHTHAGTARPCSSAPAFVVRRRPLA
jgi:hypothetical protein